MFFPLGEKYECHVQIYLQRSLPTGTLHRIMRNVLLHFANSRKGEKRHDMLCRNKSQRPEAETSLGRKIALAVMHSVKGNPYSK